MDDSNFELVGSERRPPIYNAEDYILGLRKFSKLTGLQLYLDSPLVLAETSTTSVADKKSDLVSANNRKNRNEQVHHHHHHQELEMGLKQFATITDLLIKLKDDLTLSFPSFIREFIGVPNDGVTHLLDALKAIQLAQSNITGSLNQLGSRANHVMFKKALSDEFETLLCLKICAKFEDGALKLVEHHSGLFTVAVCVMSNYSKSRVLSLQLLTRLCDMNGGHKQVSDAISMLRLRFGEPVRLKFLVGMLNSYNSPAFHISCLRFLNRFVETSKDTREKILVQTELEEAGFDLLPLKKMLLQTSASIKDRNDLLQEELDRWANNYIDVNALVKKLLDAERANRKLREELAGLKEKYRLSEDDRKRCKATLERLRYELNTEECDCSSNSNNSQVRDLDLAQVETEECSLVTVLASDGYTCITSPVISNRSITIHEVSEGEDKSNITTHVGHLKKVVRCHGTDSGLSSEESSGSDSQRHHLSSSSSSSNDEIKLHPDSSSDKSSYSEKQEKESAKETEADRLQDPDEDDDEIDVVYAERNVLQEEATTVQAETITVDRFRQRFMGTAERGQTFTEKAKDSMNAEQHPKYKAPPPPPRQRRTSSSSTSIKASLELLHVSNDLDRESPGGFEIRRPKSVAASMGINTTPPSDYEEKGPASDVAIVPKRGPRPPARKRPKSTPIPQSIHRKSRSEMVFLPDLSDGETSDGGGGGGALHTFDDEEDDEVMMASAPINNNSSNCNTLETMSARSFGFIKPSQKIRDNDMASRIRRHKSFFNADTSSITGGSNHGHHHGGRQKPSHHKNKSRPLAIRRAESFHHSRSLGDFDKLTRDDSPDLFGSRSFHYPPYPEDPEARQRGKSVERGLGTEDKARKLQKSKSMEFLKAKFLSRKSSTKSQVQPQHNHGPLDSRMFNNPQRPNSVAAGESAPKYDWRQDTPFWNNTNKSRHKPQVPANKPKLREEPWTHLHGPASLWPAGQHGYPPGLFFGRKAGVPGGGGGNFYPTFNVANPKNPSNVSRNIVLPPTAAAAAAAAAAASRSAGGPQFHHHPVAFAAAAAAAAAQAAAQAAAASKISVNPVLSESLKDRLEITELSDAEENNSQQHQQPLIPTPDYRRPPSEASGRSSGSHHGKILDIPSGLY